MPETEPYRQEVPYGLMVADDCHYLTDNPAIGPALAEHYWARGNGQSHNQTLLSLTGESFNAKYLAERCNQTLEQAWEKAQACIASAARRQYPASSTQSLDAVIRVEDGAARCVKLRGRNDGTATPPARTFTLEFS